MLAVHRLLVQLRATAPIRLPPHPAIVLYASVAEALALSPRSERAVPDGVCVDSVEISRLELHPGDDYHFGLHILGHNAVAIGQLVRHLHAGLITLGTQRPNSRPVLGGNFRLMGILNLATGESVGTGTTVAPLPDELFQSELAAIHEARRLTLRFHAPLCTARSKTAGHRQPRRNHFDRDYFAPGLFLNRIRSRLERFGLPQAEPDSTPTVTANDLVWWDIPFRNADPGKTLCGAMGHVVLEGVTPEVAVLLVLGQYARIGEGTRFGLGAYRILELGTDPYGYSRSSSLVALALQHHLDAAAAEADLPSGELRHAAEAIRAGTYRPDPPQRIAIPKSSGGERTLAIPTRRDRALQTAVVRQIAPAIDRFLEESSFAYRRGFSRERAAAAVNRAIRDGFTHGVLADFANFFDRINHHELATRLDACLGDADLTKLIMDWVHSGNSPIGLPTGSPLSPLLANLYLDQFDEHIAERGGRLIRYADDFLILTRTVAEATVLLTAAVEEASALCLTLNDAKTKVVDPRQPFRFLGFLFEPVEGDWQATGELQPMPLLEVGWQQAVRDPSPWRFLLPGEEPDCVNTRFRNAVLGPGLDRIRFENGFLVPTFRGQEDQPGVPLRHLSELTILGAVAWERQAMNAVLEHRVVVAFADDSGQPNGLLTPDGRFIDHPRALAAQLVARQSEARRLELSRSLILAKLRNYAALAHAIPRIDGQPDSLAPALLDDAARVEKAQSLAALRGIEGAAAARWYRDLRHRLPYGFYFDRRVAPHAADPVNVLLNIAQTTLHNHCILAARAAGLSPALGILHECRAGHAAFASDLQEPFRHFMDRCVLEACHVLKPADFALGDPLESPYRLIIRPAAARDFRALVASQLAHQYRRRDHAESRSIHDWIGILARNLRQVLLAPGQPLIPFEHPA